MNDKCEKYKKKYYAENLNWKKRDIVLLYKSENPNWSLKQCKDKADELYKELKKMNKKMFRDDDRFFKMNKPFSYIDNKDSEFSDIYYDWQD